MKLNHNDEKSTKHLKELIEALKKQNLKLKIENRNLLSLKDVIKKLQEEKMDLSRKLMEMEGEVVLYKDTNDINDEMLYNPRRGSRFSTISQKESNKKISASSSKEIKKFNFKISKENFCLIAKNSLRKEIDFLKNELLKKDKIIAQLKLENFNIKKNKPDLKEINDSISDENENESRANLKILLN